MQLSDLHIGPDVDDSYMLRAFALASSLKPDILAFTGDFVRGAVRSNWRNSSAPCKPCPARRSRKSQFGAITTTDTGGGS